MTIRFSRVFLPALPFVMAAAAIPPVLAQSKPATIRSITTITAKADRADDMVAAMKEYSALLKKAHAGHSYTIWRSATGPAEYVRVDYHQTWADLDAGTASDPNLKEYRSELTRILQRITGSFQTDARMVDIVNPDVSIPRSGEPPKMLMLWTAHVKSGKMREAIELEKNEYTPAVKSAGIKSYQFAVARFGAPANELHASTGLDSWADLDQSNPIRKAMGDEKFRAFAEKMNALLDDYRYEVFRYQPPLSYIAEK